MNCKVLLYNLFRYILVTNPKQKPQFPFPSRKWSTRRHCALSSFFSRIKRCWIFFLKKEWIIANYVYFIIFQSLLLHLFHDHANLTSRQSYLKKTKKKNIYMRLLKISPFHRMRTKHVPFWKEGNKTRQ